MMYNQQQIITSLEYGHRLWTSRHSVGTAYRDYPHAYVADLNTPSNLGRADRARLVLFPFV
jgi:hypothetical protein